MKVTKEELEKALEYALAFIILYGCNCTFCVRHGVIKEMNENSNCMSCEKVLGSHFINKGRTRC